MARFRCLAVPLVLALPAPAHAAPPTPLESLVQAERSFSATSVEKGMKEAFLAYLGEDGIIFRPLPVNGKQSWTGRPAVPATLIWEPAFAEVSAAGDLGWTTGPWEFRPPKEAKDRPVVHGDFTSVWKRDSSGTWKVAVDLGCTHEAPTQGGLGSVKLQPGPTHSRSRDPKAALTALEAAEQTFADLSSTRDHRSALSMLGDKDLRRCSDGELPRLGVEVASGAPVDSSAYRWRPDAIRVSRSGDLGYAYGLGERLKRNGAVVDSAVFLRVWRRDSFGTWRLALAVVNPVRAR